MSSKIIDPTKTRSQREREANLEAMEKASELQVEEFTQMTNIKGNVLMHTIDEAKKRGMVEFNISLNGIGHVQGTFKPEPLPAQKVVEPTEEELKAERERLMYGHGV